MFLFWPKSTKYMWSVENEETYFRIYDEQKYLAGYFDPAYGEHVSDEEIDAMIKRKAPIPGGHLMVPMIKFNLMISDLNIDTNTLATRLDAANKALGRWSNYIKTKKFPYHHIRVAHTDQDMLTVTLPIRFHHPVGLDNKALAARITPIMVSMQRWGLL